MIRHLTRVAIALVAIWVLMSLPEWAAQYTWLGVIVILCGMAALTINAVHWARYWR